MGHTELAMLTHKTARMFGVFAIVAAITLDLVAAASTTASDSALALRAGSTSQSVSKGKSSNSSSSATNTKPAKIIMMLQLMNENLLRAGKHREEAEEQEKQIREELEEIEWKMSAREHINYITLDIEHDLPLPIINFRSKHS
jgi:hypothetical protein